MGVMGNMLYIMYQNTQYTINLKLLKRALKRLLFKTVLVLLVVAPLLTVYVDFCRFPEKYLTTWRYQLHNEIKSGNQESIDYYSRVYVANGIDLFED